jgi:peptidoglycan hydrolase-like protein with peptidoglycan-binding domain
MKRGSITVALQSNLFRGDTKLEAAAVADHAHITPGSNGAHVKKIQQALNTVDRANLTEDGVYGSRTAAAVLAYKRARSIVNPRYQTQADDIVGKMTIAALDRDLLGKPEPKVIIGRPAAGRGLSFAMASPPIAPTTANVSAVVRGNPHVRQNAVNTDGLPPSVPPGQAYEVDVSVVPALTGNDFIDVAIINSSQNNGFADVTPRQIQSSTRVRVDGDRNRQTQPGHAGKLQIQASLNGKVLAISNGFSVCAHPTSITANITPGRDIDDSSGVGMIVKETIQSDSGIVAHLDQVEWSELVEAIERNEPPFGQGSGFVNNSSYLPAIPPAGLSITDTHAEPRPSAGPKGKVLKVQVHMFKCKRCGVVDIPIPFSGFEVTHQVFQVGKEWKHQVVKQPLDTGVRTPAKKVIKARGGVGTVKSAVHSAGPK